MPKEKEKDTGYKFGDLQKFQEKTKLPTKSITIQFPINYGVCYFPEKEELMEFKRSIEKLLGVKLRTIKKKTKDTKKLGLIDLSFDLID